jgi:tetratricopeptide (TPR) repeat protein
MDGSAAAALALSSLYEYYFETAEQANEWLNANSATGERAAFQGLPEARSWMSTEVSGIVASVEEAVRTSNHIDAFRLAITVGTYLDIIRDKASCLAMAETALSAARALEDDDKEAGALNNVGLALNSMQRFSEAKSIFIEASRKYRKLGNKSGEATVLLGLCDVLRAEGHLQETVGPLKRAVRLNMECGDVRGAGFAMTNLGITLRESNQFREAIEVLLAALKVHEETKAQRAEASTLVHLGTALTQVRDYAEGMSYLFRARDYAVSSGDVVGLTAACVNIGNVYRIQGDYEAAKEQYLYAVQACEEADDDTSLALALWNLIKLSEEIRDVRAASQYKSRLLSIPQSDLPYQVKSILSKGI